MVSKEIVQIVNELIPFYKRVIIGEYAIAIAGAHAKGKADKYSDLDIFIYAKDVCSFDKRTIVFEQIADSKNEFFISNEIDSFPWGGNIDFLYHGNKIETVVKKIDKVEKEINECINGKIKIYPEAWTSNGYFNYICLSEVNFIKSIDDPFDIISKFKDNIRNYSPLLKKAIINEFWWKSSFWVDNYHYISAINRTDIVYTSRIISNTIQNIVQVLFALNEKYFDGDKKVELQLHELKFCPKSLIVNMELLLTTQKDVEFLKQQRNVLIEIINEINAEVKKV